MAGNANSGKRRDKLIRDALTLAAMRVHEGDPQGRTKLALAAAKIVEQAVSGDIPSFREMADRIDGKATQQIDVLLNDDVRLDELSDDELAAYLGALRKALAARDQVGGGAAAPLDAQPLVDVPALSEAS